MNFERENQRAKDFGNWNSSQSAYSEAGNSTSSGQTDSSKQKKEETINRNGKLIRPKSNEIFKRYIEDKLSAGEFLPFLINQRGYVLDREEVANEIYRKYGLLINSDSYIYQCGFFKEMKQLLVRQLEEQGKSEPTNEEKSRDLLKENQRHRTYASK